MSVPERCRQNSTNQVASINIYGKSTTLRSYIRAFDEGIASRIKRCEKFNGVGFVDSEVLPNNGPAHPRPSNNRANFLSIAASLFATTKKRLQQSLRSSGGDLDIMDLVGF
ncbi:hypothetical protein ANCCAN_25717 [Ancylostoma caninum]|uniref:Uncharacterized protein n=1 Tax=Ancylostoma caninum TaxID=29170 RepID=A0A368FC01_ANCCA|nr:hypothetical protein ANCCAN_25717 [Ancylostoma caninum]